MSDAQGKNGNGYRINLQFYGADHPLLASEMDKVPKGKRRVGRLLTLATMGLTHEALTRRRLKLVSLDHSNADASGPEHTASDGSGEVVNIAMSEDDVRDLLGE